jgi:hypothetical protein
MCHIVTKQVKACHDRIDDLVRARRAPGNIDIYGENILHAVHNMVQSAEHPPGRTTGTQGNHVFWFRYLFPDPAKTGGLFQGRNAGDYQDIRMTGRTFDKDPETLDIKAGHQARDDLDIAGITASAVVDGDPRGFGPRPVYKALV